IEDIAALFTQTDLAGEEDYPNAVTAESRQMNAQLNALVKEKFVRCLNHNTGAIACIIFTTAGTPMFHIFQYGQSIANVLVTFVPLNISYESNAAGIMLKGRIV